MKLKWPSFIISFLILYSCSSTKKPCEKVNYAYDKLEILPEGYERADRLSRGFIEVFNESIGIVNLILSGRNGHAGLNGVKRLVPIVFSGDLENVKCDGLPVYLVMKCTSAPCEVPGMKKLIVVAQTFPEVFKNFFYTGSILDSLYLLNPSQLLAISLLHELGHISNKDYEKPVIWDEILKGNALNTDETMIKEIEQSADDFAAFRILKACQDETDYQRRAMGFTLANTMKMVLYNLNFKRKKEIEQRIYKSLDDYYKDQGYTHKNLDLRFRQIFHMATMEGGSSITNFYEQRNGIAN